MKAFNFVTYDILDQHFRVKNAFNHRILIQYYHIFKESHSEVRFFQPNSIQPNVQSAAAMSETVKKDEPPWPNLSHIPNDLQIM